MRTLFASFSCQIVSSDLDYIPKPAGKKRSGLGLVLFSGIEYLAQHFLSSRYSCPLKNTPVTCIQAEKVPNVPAFRSGQSRHSVDTDSGPAGREI